MFFYQQNFAARPMISGIMIWMIWRSESANSFGTNRRILSAIDWEDYTTLKLKKYLEMKRYYHYHSATWSAIPPQSRNPKNIRDRSKKNSYYNQRHWYDSQYGHMEGNKLLLLIIKYVDLFGGSGSGVGSTSSYSLQKYWQLDSRLRDVKSWRVYYQYVNKLCNFLVL